MKKGSLTQWCFVLMFALCGCSHDPGYGQSLLKFEKEISLPNVNGRIDHLDVDLQHQIIYVAALDNNTVELVDLQKNTVLQTITGLSEPQGVAYISKHHEVFVANGGTGECVFYDSNTFKKIASVKYDDDADDVRYDAEHDLVYVGYGNGGIGIINAASHQKLSSISLPSHPESFQLDTRQQRLWVNLPGSGMVGVVDIKSRKLIKQWKRLLPRANFPMAYDSIQHRIMIGYRVPATLKVLDSNTGEELFSSGMVGDVDDFYWDDKAKLLLISGGAGSINIFKQISSKQYKEAANIATRHGARTSLWIPQLRLFILAARAAGGKPASLLIYKMK